MSEAGAKSEPTPTDIGAWMMEELRSRSFLDQDSAAFQVMDTFGEKFTRINDNGNRAFTREVLAAFNELSGHDVVWVRSERLWRFREFYDQPGRMQP